MEYVGIASFFNFYTKLAESSFLCRFRVESVNIFMSVKSSTELMLYVVLTMPTLNKAYLFIYYLFICAMCFSFRKQFRTCANALPNGFTVTGVKLMTVTVITVIPRWRTWNQVRIFFVD